MSKSNKDGVLKAERTDDAAKIYHAYFNRPLLQWLSFLAIYVSIRRAIFSFTHCIWLSRNFHVSLKLSLFLSLSLKIYLAFSLRRSLILPGSLCLSFAVFVWISLPLAYFKFVFCASIDRSLAWISSVMHDPPRAFLPLAHFEFVRRCDTAHTADTVEVRIVNILQSPL